MFSRLLMFSLIILSSISLVAQPKPGVDYLAILRRASAYSKVKSDSLPAFTYQSSNDPALADLRKRYQLDSVAGFGNEVSRLINILHWVHNKVKHDGLHESGIRAINASAILGAATERNIGVSCGELATTLNDCYLAMGWKSRKVYCFPKDSLRTDVDSHVINIVWLSSKEKWVWMDPTNDAYVMDEKGELQSIEEVRERLIAGKPLLVNPDANWNRKISMEKAYYLDTYMAKNLYRFYSPLRSAYNYETREREGHVVYVYLYPQDDHQKMAFRTEDEKQPGMKTTRYNLFYEKMFWESPDE